MTHDKATSEPQESADPPEVLESSGGQKVMTRQRVLWLSALAALIAIVAGTALIVHHQEPAPENTAGPPPLAAEVVAFPICGLLGYDQGVGARACQRGFVDGAMYVQGQIPEGWSDSTERKASYALTVTMSQPNALFPTFGSGQMRSEAWIKGFQGGVWSRATTEVNGSVQGKPQS